MLISFRGVSEINSPEWHQYARIEYLTVFQSTFSKFLLKRIFFIKKKTSKRAENIKEFFFKQTVKGAIKFKSVKRLPQKKPCTVLILPYISNYTKTV